MLAFSTVSQIGYMMMGLGIGTPLAITAGLLHCLNHGFFKGGLFLTAGSVQHAAGTRDMNQLGGLAQRMPQTTLSWLIGVGSMMGIPLMSGFASKWMLYAAALQAGWAVPAMIAWAVSLGTVFLGVKATSAVFLGPYHTENRDAHESPGTMVWGMGLLAAGSVILGVAPQLAVNYLLNPILAHSGAGRRCARNLARPLADAGSFSTAGGLVLAVVSLVIGGAIYALAYISRHPPPLWRDRRRRSRSQARAAESSPVASRSRTVPPDRRRFLQHLHAELASFFRWTNVDRAYLAGWSGLASHLARPRNCRVVDGAASRPARPRSCRGVCAAARWALPPVQLNPSLGGVLPAGPHMPLLLILAVAVAAVALLPASFLKISGFKIPLWPCVLIVGSLSVAGLLTPNPWLRLGLLELGALLTVVRVWHYGALAWRETHLPGSGRHFRALTHRQRRSV